eukprot:SAG31_NODE_1422_length_8420_cov_2.887514_5_plen_205_part_00
MAAASAEWNRSQPEFMAAFPDFDEIVAASAATAAAAATLAAGPSPAPRAEDIEVQASLNATSADGAKGSDMPGGDTKEDLSDIEIASSALASATAEVDLFCSDAANGMLRVAKQRNRRRQLLDEVLTGLLLTLDTLPAEVREQRRILVQQAQVLCAKVSEAAENAAAAAERPEEAAATRKAEGGASFEAGMLHAKIFRGHRKFI